MEDTQVTAPEVSSPVTSEPATGLEANIEKEMAATFDQIQGQPRLRADVELSGHEIERDSQTNDERDSQAEKSAVEKSTEQSEPPQSWNKAARQHWAALPKEARDYIRQREDEMQRAISRLGTDVKLAGQPSAEINSVVERFQNVIPRDQSGAPIPAHRALEMLLTAHHALETNPPAALQWLAQSYGINMGGDPQLTAQQEQQTAQRVYEYFAQQQAQQEQARQAAQVNALTSVIEKFAADKGDYWPDLEDEMISQVEMLRSRDPGRASFDPMGLLQDAHDRALRVLPEVEAKTSKAREKQLEFKKKADDARRAAAINVGRGSSRFTTRSASQTIESTMEEVYSRIHGH